jgi:hypothetical protein
VSYLEMALKVSRVRQSAERPEPADAPASIPGVSAATCGATCHEIEPGRWIHQPRDGCRTPMTPQPGRRKAEAVCWHCGGKRHCACSTCALEERGRPAGPCAACRATGRVLQWIQ